MAGRDMLTKNQLRVLEKLEASSGPLSAYTLLDQLREHGFRAPLQVYRALDTLVKSGFVHRLESLNAFVACAEPHDHGHSMTARSRSATNAARSPSFPTSWSASASINGSARPASWPGKR